MNNKKSYMTTAGIVTSLIVVSIIIINILFSVVGTKVNLKIDMTKDKVLSFSDTTMDTLHKLDREVNVYSLIPAKAEGTVVNQLREIIEKYAKISSKINYQVIDTEKNPEFAKKYTQAGEVLSTYSIIFDAGKKFKVVNLNEAIVTDASGQGIQSIRAERLFTSALIYVTSDKVVKLGVLEGHGEIVSSLYFEALLEDEGYEVVPINLMTSDIESDINSIIITTPEKDFDASEIEKIDKFLYNGNSMQLFMPPGGAPTPKLDAYLAEWGIEFKSGFVAETNKNNYYQSQVYLIPEMVDCEITSGLISGGMMILYPGCRGIKENKNQYVTEQVLLQSTKDAITKVNMTDSSSGEIVAADGDVVEKSNLATIVTREISADKKAKIFVSGGLNFLQQSLMESNFANKDFYFNTVASLCDNDANIYIRDKNISTPYITISALWGLIFGFVTIIVIPLSFLIAGLVIWLRRRHL